MTPTEFDFTVTIPGDERLVAAVRQLVTHAAGYAQLSPQAGDQLAGHVERATSTAIAAATVPNIPIDYRITGTAEALVVVLSCDVGPAARCPEPVANGTVTIDWTAAGTRQTCRIRQRLG